MALRYWTHLLWDGTSVYTLVDPTEDTPWLRYCHHYVSVPCVTSAGTLDHGGKKHERDEGDPDYPAAAPADPEYLAVVRTVRNAHTGKLRTVRAGFKIHRVGCPSLRRSPPAAKKLPERMDPWNKTWLPAEVEAAEVWPSLKAGTCRRCENA